MKKIALIGTIALIVLGCVVAAGCTSTESSPATDPIVGHWIYYSEDSTVLDDITITSEGKFFVKDGESGNTTYGIWKKNPENVGGYPNVYYLLESDGLPTNVSLSADGKTLTAIYNKNELSNYDPTVLLNPVYIRQ
ncbi:MAG TPA: hypothetical protein O0X27_02030 [Methanocorpusculum sp.]|nr:hypothetical protein [Methanocorpusculum sp.]